MRLAQAFTFAASVAASMGLFATSFVASAADYPTKPVKVIVSYPAGGITDIYARKFAEKLQDRLKQPFLIENKPGAGGMIGSEQVAKSAPDGYTLTYVGTSTLLPVILRQSVKDPTVDLLRDFEPIALMNLGSFGLIVNSAVPVKNLREFIDYNKANPGKLFYGTSSGSGKMVMEVFKKAAGIDIQHVPYKGTAPLTTALVAGEVTAVLEPTATYKTFIESGKLRAIATTGEKRLSTLPDTPTLVESGYPSIKGVYSGGFWGPKGLPPAVVATLSKPLMEFARMQDIIDLLKSSGVDAIGSTPEGLRQQALVENEFWTRAAQIAEIPPAQ